MSVSARRNTQDAIAKQRHQQLCYTHKQVHALITIVNTVFVSNQPLLPSRTIFASAILVIPVQIHSLSSCNLEMKFSLNLGKRCEYLTSLSFVDNSSLVELEPLRTRPEANVTIVFMTTQENGVLVYDGRNGEHIAIELFNGRIRVSYDVGNYPTSTMYSYEMVSDGKPHVAELLAIKKNFTMRVDRGTPRSINNEGPRDYLKLVTPMYVGGLAPEVASVAFTEFHLRNVTSFRGRY